MASSPTRALAGGSFAVEVRHDEAHWARGYQLVKDELDTCSGDEAKLVARLADFVPDGDAPEISTTTTGHGSIGEIKLKVGSASRTPTAPAIS